MRFLKRLAYPRLKVAVQRTGLLLVATGLSLLFTPVVVRTVAGTLLYFLELAVTFSRKASGQVTKTKLYGEFTHR